MFPPSDDRPNRFQRLYFAWARPHYARMPPPLGAEAERIDRWLYSRAGLPFWCCLSAAVVLTIGILAAAGMSWFDAVSGALGAWLFVAFVALAAWMRPEPYTRSRLLRSVVVALGLAYVGAVGGFVVAYLAKHGVVDLAALPLTLATGLLRATPLLVLLIATVVLLSWGVSALKRHRAQKEIAWLRLAHERDATARLLAEARLVLLQRQIQPHFIFNTLAAVQHRVDQRDPRAGPLLHALTAFLRGSTELLALDRTSLGVEAETVRHYLAIMTARLGERLATSVAIAPSAAPQTVPPGLLLTLVENAIEHGISPSLAGGRIDVTANDDGDRWTLCVRNGGVPLAPDWRDGVGLANCRERLARLIGDRASLVLATDGDATIATVRIDRGASS